MVGVGQIIDIGLPMNHQHILTEQLSQSFKQHKPLLIVGYHSPTPYVIDDNDKSLSGDNNHVVAFECSREQTVHQRQNNPVIGRFYLDDNLINQIKNHLKSSVEKPNAIASNLSLDIPSANNNYHQTLDLMWLYSQKQQSPVLYLCLNLYDDANKTDYSFRTPIDLAIIQQSLN